MNHRPSRWDSPMGGGGSVSPPAGWCSGRAAQSHPGVNPAIPAASTSAGTFNAVLFYDDAEAARRAAAVSVKIAAAHKPDARVIHSVWPFNLFDQPALRPLAARDLARCDAVVVSCGSWVLPEAAAAGLDACLADNRRANLEVVLLFAPDESWSITIRRSPGFSTGGTASARVIRCGYRTPPDGTWVRPAHDQPGGPGNPAPAKDRPYPPAVK